MTPREAASAAELARVLRERLLRGDYGEAGTVPSRVALRDEFKVSAETASVALRMLAAEGLIRLEQGKRSAVLPVRRYDVTVTVPSGHPARATEAARERAELRARVQEGDDPAVGAARAALDGERLQVSMTVTAGDSGRAAARAMGVTAVACEGPDGWDLAAASVAARPA